MKLRHSVISMMLAGVLLCPAMAWATAESGVVETTTREQDNLLEVRQFHVENARLPGQGSIRQTVTAWQVTAGTWNGVSLEGLAVVLVQSQSEENRGVRTMNCYISHTASVQQREALMSAFMSTQPEYFGAAQMQMMRMEPGVITIEVDGAMVTLHLGLIA